MVLFFAMILWNDKCKQTQTENSADWSQIYRLTITVVLVVTTLNFTPRSVHTFYRRRPALFNWTILGVKTAFYKSVVLSLTNLKRAMLRVTHHISFITFFFNSVFFAVFPRYTWPAIEALKTEASWKWPKNQFQHTGKEMWWVSHGTRSLHFVH